MSKATAGRYLNRGETVEDTLSANPSMAANTVRMST